MNTNDNIDTNDTNDNTLNSVVTNETDANLNDHATRHSPSFFAALIEPKDFDPAGMVERAMENITSAEVTTLESKFVSVVLNVRCYTADVGNKKVAADAARVNGAAESVVRGMVNLFNNHPLLAKMKSLSGAIRTASLNMTKPSSVEGERILPIMDQGDYMAKINALITPYYEAREEFCAAYFDLMEEGQRALGDLADSVRYPSVAQVRERFAVQMRIQPLSGGGVYDDIHQSARNELTDMFNDSLKHIMASMMRHAWSELYEVIYKMINSLTDKVDEVTGDSGKKRLHTATLLDNPRRYIDRLETYNVANDPDMDEAVMELKRVISGMDIEELREEPRFREHIKGELEEIISKFDF